jgi:hypothetical protein
MPRPGLTWLLAGGLLGVALVLLGAAAGWYGPLVTCGVDGAAVCVAWPLPIAALVWLGFVGFFIGLGLWHLWSWRRGRGS